MLTFLPYISAIAVVLSMIASAATAFVALKLENRLYKFKDELLVSVNGRYLHSDVAEEKFDSINEKLDDLKWQVARK